MIKNINTVVVFLDYMKLHKESSAAMKSHD